MRVAFTGRKGLGGVKMRGQDVARELGVKFIDLKRFPTRHRYDCIVLVKYWDESAKAVRASCDRLVFDPLDCWSSTRPNMEPGRFWKWCRDELNFNEIISTSPSCERTMDLLRVPVHYLRHHCDPDLHMGWDPNGPVVYSGGLQFIRPQVNEIRYACESLGKKFVISTGRGCEKALHGASLCLHLRLWPEDTILNKWCKPQVKLENAKVVGLPMLATGHACLVSLRPKGAVWRTDCSTWAEAIDMALKAPCQNNPHTLQHHVELISKVIYGG